MNYKKTMGWQIMNFMDSTQDGALFSGEEDDWQHLKVELAARGLTLVCNPLHLCRWFELKHTKVKITRLLPYKCVSVISINYFHFWVGNGSRKILA